MATQRSTVDFILEQTAGAGDVSARAMFGEYGFYCDGKILGLICDDTLFLKYTPGAAALIPDADMGPPYTGAKPHLIADGLLDDPDSFVPLLRAIWDDVPQPKPKAPRKRKGG